MSFSEWIILRTGGQTFYITNISVDLAHRVIFCANVGKGGTFYNNIDLYCNESKKVSALFI